MKLTHYLFWIFLAFAPVIVTAQEAACRVCDYSKNGPEKQQVLSILGTLFTNLNKSVEFLQDVEHIGQNAPTDTKKLMLKHFDSAQIFSRALMVSSKCMVVYNRSEAHLHMSEQSHFLEPDTDKERQTRDKARAAFLYLLKLQKQNTELRNHEKEIRKEADMLMKEFQMTQLKARLYATVKLYLGLTEYYDFKIVCFFIRNDLC
jgi:hypothetical protein